MTREEAIKALERAEDYAGIQCVNNCVNAYISPYLLKAIDFAVLALREQEERENLKPLTLDELRKMIGDPVYIVDLCNRGGLLTGWIVFSGYREDGFVSKGDHGWFPVKGYGKRWIAYRNKPKEDM